MRNKFFYISGVVLLLAVMAGCRKQEEQPDPVIPDGTYRGIWNYHYMVVDPPGSGYHFNDTAYEAAISVENTSDSIAFIVNGMLYRKFKREDALSYFYRYQVWIYEEYTYQPEGHILNFSSISHMSGLNEPNITISFSGTSE